MLNVREKRKNKIDPQIIYEDSDVLVLDKPAGWIVNEAETTKDLFTLQSWLQKKSYPLSKNFYMRSGIVHRLDKETSGLLLVAKNEESFTKLQKQFKNRLVSKTYIALVHDKLILKKAKVEAPIGRLPWNKMRFGVVPGGKDAFTEYVVVDYYNKGYNNYTLVEVFPKTGRTHQIRVHFKYLGHPIVSDELYAGRKVAIADRLWCPRLFLHAGALEFDHPKKEKRIKVRSKLPEDLEKALKSLTPLC